MTSANLKLRMGSVISHSTQRHERWNLAKVDCLDKVSLMPCCRNSVSRCGCSPGHLMLRNEQDTLSWSRKLTSKLSLVSMEEEAVPMKKLKVLNSKTKLSRSRNISCPRGGFLSTFLELFDDDFIQDFMWMDSCAVLLDKYLIAMVYIYFRRAQLSKKEYTQLNFFLALHLAHDIEEDNEDLKQEIYPWALGRKWESKYVKFLLARDILWKRMNYRAFVSKVTCEEVFELCPNHPLWLRERKIHHGGAIRLYPPELDADYQPKGPWKSPVFCDLCFFSESDQNSPTFTSGYLSHNSLDLNSDF